MLRMGQVKRSTPNAKIKYQMSFLMTLTVSLFYPWKTATAGELLPLPTPCYGKYHNIKLF
jgi:hypothetical protein